MKSVLSFVALAIAAGSASAIVVSARPINEAAGYGERATSVFTALDAPYVGFAAAAGPIGFDDYTSTMPAGTYDNLTVMQFVGGVSTVGGRLDINFYLPGSTTVFSSFFVTLPTAGNFIWTIGSDANPINLLIPAQGVVEMVAASTTTGRWFLSTTAPTLGTESRTFGSTTTHSHRFDLAVPAPGCLALLGLGGLVAGRRRR